MNKEKILSAMDHIDPALVEEADRAAPARRRIGWSRPGLIAACLCLVLAGTAVAAAGISKVRVSKWFDNVRYFDFVGDGRLYDGFEVVGGVAYIPASSLSREVNQLAEEHPRESFFQAFDDWEEIEEFIGRDLADNPVLESAQKGAAGLMPSGQSVPVSSSGTHCWLGVAGGDKLNAVEAEAGYYLHVEPEESDGTYVRKNRVEIVLNAHLLTDNFRESKPGQDEDDISSSGEFYPAGTQITLENYVTPSGLETEIFCITPQERTAFRWVVMKGYDFVPVEPTTYSAYFSLNGARFHLEAAHDTDAALALETLKEVLDGFVTESQAQ